MTEPLTSRPPRDQSRRHAPCVEQVRDALIHLHDPTHLERHPIGLHVPPTRRPSASPGRTLRQALLEAADRHPSLARRITLDVRAVWHAAIAAARSTLDDARFDGLWAEGRALTDDEAIALAATTAS